MVVDAASRTIGTRAGALLGEGTFNDPTNARTIYLAAGGLALVGVLLAIATVVWWRSTRAEHPALAPLEVMGTRRWSKSDYAGRQARLASVRSGRVTGGARADRCAGRGGRTA
jgi:hypothetical protein